MQLCKLIKDFWGNALKATCRSVWMLRPADGRLQVAHGHVVMPQAAGHVADAGVTGVRSMSKFQGLHSLQVAECFQVFSAAESADVSRVLRENFLQSPEES